MAGRNVRPGDRVRYAISHSAVKGDAEKVFGMDFDGGMLGKGGDVGGPAMLIILAAMALDPIRFVLTLLLCLASRHWIMVPIAGILSGGAIGFYIMTQDPTYTAERFVLSVVASLIQATAIVGVRQLWASRQAPGRAG